LDTLIGPRGEAGTSAEIFNKTFNIQHSIYLKSPTFSSIRLPNKFLFLLKIFCCKNRNKLFL
jgi:hypothetical protein